MHGKEIVGKSGNGIYFATFTSTEIRVINNAIRSREIVAAERDEDVPDMESGVLWYESKDGKETNVTIPGNHAEAWLNDVTDTLCLYQANLRQRSGQLLSLDPEQYEELVKLRGEHVVAAIRLTEAIDRAIIDMQPDEGDLD